MIVTCAIGVLVILAGVLVALDLGVAGFHHGLQSFIKLTRIGIRRAGAALHFRQGFPAVAAGVIALGVGGQKGAVFSAGTPVDHGAANGDVRHILRTGIACGGGGDGFGGPHAAARAEQQAQHQKNGKQFAHGVLLF